MPLSAGTRLGSYEIIAPLGTGGMGEVYRARDLRLQREIALKLLPRHVADDAARLERFEREARSLASVSHPNIVTIHSVEIVGDDRLLTMELVEGEPLSRTIRPPGVPLAEFFSLALPLADALAAAHDRGVTHRDLKPANIIVRRDGRPTIVDFGLARQLSDDAGAAETSPALTQPGLIVGTPRYMSPEQAQGRRVDARSDLFSLGAVLYELLTGRPAFDGETAAEALAAVLRDAPAIPAHRTDVPDDVWRVVARCLEKSPDRRFASAHELRRTLDDVRRGLAPRPVTIRAVGVLPLRNLSGREDEEYFADGMTDALITELARIDGLKVISRGSTMGFRQSPPDLAGIGRALGVEALVEGSVLRSGDRVRISARLVRADTGEYFWAERYDRELADVLALQGDVAQSIAAAVDRTLRGASSSRGRVDPEVYLLDLRARHFFHRRTEAGFRSAVKLFEDALTRDPDYAPAHVGLADALSMLANYGIVAPADIRPRARAAVARALEIDPHSAEVHRVLAFFHWQFEFAWDAAIAEYERALELDPNSASAVYWYGAYLAVIGQFQRSDVLLKRARELDPLSLVVPSVQGWSRYFARRFEEALSYFPPVLAIDPDFHLALWFHGEALIELGRYAEGIESLERAYERGGRSSRLLGYLGYAYGRAGDASRARAALAELDARARERYVPPYFPALVAAGLGDADAAIDRLEEALRTGDTMLRDLKADAQWDRLRDLPRFKSIANRLAFPA